MGISGLNHAASAPALLRFAFVSPLRARLASGWLASLYREGVAPSGSLRQVSDHMILLLSWHPDAIEFTFTPTHGSWLNLVEGFFSKLTRSVLRHIRVASKQELKDRIMAAMDYFNQQPVVHTWSYKLDQAA